MVRRVAIQQLLILPRRLERLLQTVVSNLSRRPQNLLVAHSLANPAASMFSYITENRFSHSNDISFRSHMILYMHRVLNSEVGLQSHTKAKHGDK
jgi:hypothetical protein